MVAFVGVWTLVMLHCLVSMPQCYHGRRLVQESLPIAPITIIEGSIVRLSDSHAFIAARGRIAPGTPLTESPKNRSMSLEECSITCEKTTNCNVFWYCSSQIEDCTTSVGTIESGECQLVTQDLASPGRMAPVQFAESGEPVDFISGAPIDSDLSNLPPIQGYVLLYAQSYYDRLDYSCPDSLLPTSDTCLIQGTPYQISERCKQDSKCQAFTFHPNGRTDLGLNIGVLKGGADVKTMSGVLPNLNQQAVTYLKDAALVSGSDSGGLTGGEIAGIGIGCAVAGSIVTCAVFLVMKSRNKKTDKKLSLKANGGLDSRSNETNNEQTQNTSPWNSDASGVPSSIDHVLGNRIGGSQRDYVNGSNARQFAEHGMFPPISTGRHWTHVSPFDGPNSPLVVPISAVPSRNFLEQVSGSTASPPKQKTVGMQHLSRPKSNSSSDSSNSDSETTSGIDGRSMFDKDKVLKAIRDSNWGHYNIDFEKIEWLYKPNGSIWQLGSGAFSQVFLVKVGGVDQCAAKVIVLQGQKSEEIFLREVKMLFHLRHTNIVQFTGICVHQGRGIILMEYMEGGSLHSRLKSDSLSLTEEGDTVSPYAGEFSWYSRGKDVILGILQALHYLHGLGLMHLDLKSENVLLTADGNAKVADVGFTRMKETLALSQGLGTFAYAAPELLLGGTVSFAADIYSFGVLLREICTCEGPVRGLSRDPMVPEECPPAVFEIMERCLSEKPEDRPSARQLFDEIQSM